MRWRVGTSGFSYDGWAGSFYPPALPGARRLAFYASQLPAVEINNTFYRMPKPAVLAGWAAQVPASFRFALKAPRRITHAKGFAFEPDAIAHLFGVADALGGRLGPVLFQLPPWLRKDVARLRELLAAVPPGRRAALEFRHRSWLDDEVHALLRERDTALCAADFDEAEKRVPVVATASFGYLRLRAADYGDDALRAWIAEIAAPPWQDVYVFFKHEEAGAAPRLAARLLELAGAAEPSREIQRVAPRQREADSGGGAV